MQIEKTEHFFGDAVDLLNLSTDEMITVPMEMYKEMNTRGLSDMEIFREIRAVNMKQVYIRSRGVVIEW
jgi:hypothetical protein